MSTESLPSKNVVLLDVPEVQSLTAEFQYFYWTADEFENGLGSSEAAARQLPSETFDASYVSKTRKLPRMVKLTWQPVLLNPVVEAQNRIRIRDNISKLHSEESFTSNDFTTFRYQDNGIDMKLKFFVDKFLALLPELGTVNSADELISLVNSRTTDRVTAQFLAEIIANLGSQGVQFGSGGSTGTVLMEKIKNVVLTTRLNNRVLIPISKTIKEDGLGIFSDEISSNEFQNRITSIQNSAVANANASLLSPFDYDFEVLAYVGYKPIDSTAYEPSVKTLGYIIEKRELRRDGTEERHNPIVIENALVNTTFDAQVRYDSTYFYQIRAVYLVEVKAIDDVSRENLMVSFLVGSSFSPEQKVRTVENVAPPPPADFDLSWDYGARALRCTWNLPNNPQQDIKYIQLFRRRTINEPFQLIKMWDFNDTRTRVQLNEFPYPELVERVRSFVGFYLDKEFSKESNYIYAVASIDAHGLVSNYSLQFQVKFDKFENKLVKKLISVSGAPRQYPNAYLNADTFVDTIKDSGHKNIKIVFNPDYLKLLNHQSSDLRLLKTTRNNGKYRLQLINTDLQAQQNIDIVLQDSRRTNRNS